MSDDESKLKTKPYPVVDDLYIYRFVSFYELYHLCQNKKLKLSLLAVQDDKNEGVGATLRFAAPEWASFYTNADKVFQQHAYAVHNTYITCWTMEPDSVAMWLLYSPNKEGIRVRTTTGKLKSALAAYEKINSWTNHLHYTDGSELLTWCWDLKPVHYVNLDILLAEMNETYTQFKNLCKELAAGNPEWWTDEDGFLKKYPEFIDEFRNRFELGYFIKDSGFVHEKELRGVVNAGIRNSLDVEKWKKSEDLTLTPFKPAEPGVLPSFIYAPISDDFIDEICFDPRMPEYKKQVVRDVLSPLGELEEASRCFNSLVDKRLRFDPFEGIRPEANAQQYAPVDPTKRRG